jgi:hypothetical protein
LPGPARFQRRGDPANNGFSNVGHSSHDGSILSGGRFITSAHRAAELKQD